AIGPDDDMPESPDVVMLSDACWRRYYNADATVIGRMIFLNKTPFTIIGILPASFHGTDGSTLVPMHYIPWKSSPDSGYLIGRLKAGATKEQAQTDLAGIASRLSVENNRRTSIVVYPAHATNPLLIGQFSLLAVLFMIVVGIVLLIACANVAILLLSRWT